MEKGLFLKEDTRRGGTTWKSISKEAARIKVAQSLQYYERMEKQGRRRSSSLSCGFPTRDDYQDDDNEPHPPIMKMSDDTQERSLQKVTSSSDNTEATDKEWMPESFDDRNLLDTYVLQDPASVAPNTTERSTLDSQVHVSSCLE